ncbi:hypothetical protein PS3A_52400 [Pseudomonas sp. 3A(2025)]
MVTVQKGLDLGEQLNIGHVEYLGQGKKSHAFRVLFGCRAILIEHDPDLFVPATYANGQTGTLAMKSTIFHLEGAFPGVRAAHILGSLLQ